MLKKGTDELFKIYNWYPEGKKVIHFSLAVACLLKGEYQEGYQKLLEVKEMYVNNDYASLSYYWKENDSGYLSIGKELFYFVTKRIPYLCGFWRFANA